MPKDRARTLKVGGREGEVKTSARWQSEKSENGIEGGWSALVEGGQNASVEGGRNALVEGEWSAAVGEKTKNLPVRKERRVNYG
jgi:hypothetical protein